MDRRGSSLATTLVFTALALTLALALAGTSVSHLHFAASQAHTQRARAAAEAALALAVERVMTNPDFGRAGEVVEVELDDATGRVTFDPGEALRSTSNRGNPEAIAGWDDRVVPAEAVHLVSRGRSAGRQAGAEAILLFPEFPYALASSGPVHSQGSLVVGGIEKLEDAFPAVDPEALLPADLASNAAGEAVVLEGEAVVTGDIQAVGDVVLGEDVQLRGQVKRGSDPVPVQKVDIAELRPDSSEPLTETHGVRLRGARHYNQNRLELTGGLELEDGILFVNGDLEIHGGVVGRGALIVDGRVTIHDGAALAADNQVALVASDTVTITGLDSGTSFFQGLVYTEGDLIAQDVTLMGAFVANREAGPLDPGSRLTLENAGVVHFPEFASFETELRLITFQIPGNKEDDYYAGMYTLEGTSDTWSELQELSRRLREQERQNTFIQRLRDILLEGNLKVNGQPFKPGDGESEHNRLDTLVWKLWEAIDHSPDQVNMQYRDQPIYRFDLNEFLAQSSRARMGLYREF